MALRQSIDRVDPRKAELDKKRRLDFA